MANEFAMIDRALDEVLVQLGGMVLTLASPEVTTTTEQRQAFARSVDRYSFAQRLQMPSCKRDEGQA
jgi:hypothetical protein